MTDSTISRLGTRIGSASFTAPQPVELRGRAAARRGTVRSAKPSEAVGETKQPAQAIEQASPEAPPPSAPQIAPQTESKPEPRFSVRKRLAVLLAAIAVPAFAAPGEFGAEPGAAPTEAETLDALTADQPAMPFEKAGMSFPGSAFYYLDDPPEESLVALPSFDPLDFGAEAGYELGELIDAGPSASPFTVGGSGLSKARAQSCLAQAVWYEAASESEAGQRAVAQVVLNRVAHSSWPSSVCGVVYEGSQRTTGCQFSFTCDGSLARKASGASWTRAQRIAAAALAGDIYAPIGLATHYHTLWVNPYWAGSLDHVGTIGAHRFYRNRGRAGRKEAFGRGYSGFEPRVRGRTTPPPAGTPSGNVTAPLPDFSALGGARAGSSGNASGSGLQGPAAASPSGPASAAPTGSPLADPSLRNAGQVKQEYSNAGKWKKRPGAVDTSNSSADSKDPK
ncbi:MAG: cell wall hydrolase [Pseudomonadota bacterium]